MKNQPGNIPRLIAAAVVSALAMAAVPSEAGKKIDVCHVPPGNPGNAHTISVNVHAWPAHESHGDTMGQCPDTDTGDGGAPGAGNPSAGTAFIVKLCDNREGERGRRIQVNGTGRVAVSGTQCN